MKSYYHNKYDFVLRKGMFMEYNFSKIMRRYNHLLGETEAVYHEMSLKLGLSDSAFIILYALCEQGNGCLQKDICAQAFVSKQTINSSIRRAFP